MARKHIKTMNEQALMDLETARPGIKERPTTTPAIPKIRPGRPIPTKRPGKKEQGKPMAEYQEIIDQFFNELEEIKDTPEGQAIIKNLHNKYAK